MSILAYIAGPMTLGETRPTAGTHTGQPDPHTLINGQVDPHAPEIGPAIIVNPREFGPTGWGDWNEQQFQSGHTNNLRTNPSAEQGWGVGPERKWGHYPTPDSPNPFRDTGVLRRNGGDTYSTLVYRPEVAAYWVQSMRREAAWAPLKERGRSGVVNQAPSVPYVQTVPPIRPGGY